MSRIRTAQFQVGILSLFVVAILVGSASTLDAATVTASWDPNPASDDIAGYLLSYGTQSDVYLHDGQRRERHDLVADADGRAGILLRRAGGQHVRIDQPVFR